jgi:tRNA_anti-like
MPNDSDLPVAKRAPPLPSTVPRAVWMAGVISLIFSLCVLCAGAVGIGVAVIGSRSQAATPMPSLTPAELYLAYDQNEAEADLDYLNKTVEIVGENDAHHQKVRKENGRYIYDFRSNCKRDWIHASPRFALAVVFRDSEISKLAKLKNGDTMTIRGKCVGRLVSDFSYGGKYPLVVDAVLTTDRDNQP